MNHHTQYPAHLREHALRTALAELAVHFADEIVSHSPDYLTFTDPMGEIIAVLWKTNQKDELGMFVGEIFLAVRRHFDNGNRPVLADFLAQLPRCINTGLLQFDDTDIVEMKEFLDAYIPVSCFGPANADEADKA